MSGANPTVCMTEILQVCTGQGDTKICQEADRLYAPSIGCVDQCGNYGAVSSSLYPTFLVFSTSQEVPYPRSPWRLLLLFVWTYNKDIPCTEASSSLATINYRPTMNYGIEFGLRTLADWLSFPSVFGVQNLMMYVAQHPCTTPNVY
jgi:hypothetical protein